MPDGKDHRLSRDLEALRAETIRTQGEAAWETVARYLDLPDETLATRRRALRTGRDAPIVGVAPRKAPALVRNPNGPKGVSWQETKGERGDPTRARLRLYVVRGRRIRCHRCERLIDVGDEACSVSTLATLRRYCPPCGTAEYDRLLAGGKPGEGSEA